MSHRFVFFLWVALGLGAAVVGILMILMIAMGHAYGRAFDYLLAAALGYVEWDICRLWLSQPPSRICRRWLADLMEGVVARAALRVMSQRDADLGMEPPHSMFG